MVVVLRRCACYISPPFSFSFHLCSSPLLLNQVPHDLSVPSIVEHIHSPNPVKQLAGVESCRKLLSRERNPPLDSIIQYVHPSPPS